MQHQPDRRRDEGSVTVELVLLTPLLVLVLVAIVMFGRLADSRGEVDDAAHQAARAASLARSPGEAQTLAEQAAQSALSGNGVTCERLAVATDTADFRPGGTVRVSVTCNVALGGLSPLPVPGTQALTGSASSTVDTYRGMALGFANSEVPKASNRSVGGDL